MANLHVVRVNWTGFPGAPGVSTLYFDDSASPPLAAVRTFFMALLAGIPTNVLCDYPNTGRTISLAGTVIGSWSTTAAASTPGTGATGNYASPVGGMIRWNSGTFVNGRELRGRTFVVPIATNGYQTNGNLAAGTVSAFQTAANTFLTAAPTFRIWSRRNAAAATCSSATALTKTVVLRSRRD